MNTRTKNREWLSAISGFCVVGRLENQIQGSSGALFAAGLDGGNTIIFMFLKKMKMQTSLATWTKTASFQHENWRF